MQLDFLQFCRDFNIPFATEDHKHTRPGWVQVACPLCAGNVGLHLGYNEDSDYFNCWRCGVHRDKEELIAKLAGCSLHRAKELLRQYNTRRGASTERTERKQAESIVLPTGTMPMTDRHKRYLKRRKFDADELEDIWDLRGTGPIGVYKLRIIAPIHYRGDIVSYQGRDITNKSKLKYKACSMDLEVRHHKKCLYGIDKVARDGIVIVEGITDVWRLGPGAVATFGIAFTRAQIILLKQFTRKYIMFDSEDDQAMKQAEVLAAALSGFDGEVEVLDIGKRDPADLDEKEAKKIMFDLDVL